LAQAEEYMLESYCEKAKLRDGQEVLDLGCGIALFKYNLT
jgi:cyclopropane fatty-acyl-phospholipid synthase-like methyltransferase